MGRNEIAVRLAWAVRPFTRETDNISETDKRLHKNTVMDPKLLESQNVLFQEKCVELQICHQTTQIKIGEQTWTVVEAKPVQAPRHWLDCAPSCY